MGFDDGGSWVLMTVEIDVGFDNGGDWRGGDRWVSPSSLSHFLRYYMALSITHQIGALAETLIPLETQAQSPGRQRPWVAEFVVAGFFYHLIFMVAGFFFFFWRGGVYC